MATYLPVGPIPATAAFNASTPFPTQVAFFRAGGQGGPAFDSYQFATAQAVTDGSEIDMIGAVLATYKVAIARVGPAGGIVPVPMPGEQSQAWNVPEPTTPGYLFPTAGQSLIARYVPDPFSPQGWRFDAWVNQGWDVMPDGHEIVTLPDGQSVLFLVAGRNDPTGAIIGIPYTDAQGTLPTGGGGGGGGGGGDGGGGDGETDDELTIKLDQVLAELGEILTVLQVPQPTGGPTDQCCQNVVAAIASVTKALVAIGVELPSLAGGGVAPPPPDLTPIVTALDAIAQAVGTIPQPTPVDIKCICDGLQAIADKLPAGGAGDLSGVVQQLTRRNDDLQVPEDWKNQLIASGAVPTDLVPLLQGTTWETVAAGAAHAVAWALGVGLADATAIVERVFKVFVAPAAGAMWKILTDSLRTFDTAAGPALGDVAQLAKRLLTGLDAAVTTIFGGAANLVLDGYEAGIAGIDLSTDTGINLALQTLLGRAFELGMGAHVMATLPELAYFTKSLGLNATAALLAELAGFHEVMINSHRPFMTAVLGRPYTYSVNRKFPTALPAIGAAQTWYGRRIVDRPTFEHLAASGGMAGIWYQALERAAFRPVQPRTLVNMFTDAPFPRDVIGDILRDNAYSDEHIATMLDAFEYNSTKSLRAAYVNKAIAAYGRGVVGDAELSSIFDAVNWSPVARQYGTAIATLERRTTIASEVEAETVAMVSDGLIDEPTGAAKIEAAGVEVWQADLKSGLAAEKATLRARRKELAAEARAMMQEKRNASRAAVARFQRGLIDRATLRAELLAIWVDPILVDSIVAVQAETRSGRARLIFGQLLSPTDAKLLEERIAAIGQQVKDQLLDFDTARAQLRALNVDTPDIDALLARWAATLKKSPGAAQLLSPLTGKPPA